MIQDLEWTDLDRKAVDTARVLAMDAVQKVGNGHPGTAMSLAPAAYLLFQKVMRHDPADTEWTGRDRFVLSAGHSSITQYVQLFLSGAGLAYTLLGKPDIGLLKNFTQIRRGGLPQSEIRVGNPNIVLDAGGNPVAYRYAYTAQTGNPRLRPIQADQFDISIEKYAGDVGSFSLAGFYKRFRDYIQNGTFSVPVTNGGVTREVIVTGPVNGDGASIYGFEAAFQRYFDFLPGLLSGFGVQANYTYIKNDGVKNAQLVVDTTGGSAVARSALSGMIQTVTP